MTRLVVLAVAVAAAAHGATVAASGAVEPILKLALQRADMPATTRKPPIASPSPAPIPRSALRGGQSPIVSSVGSPETGRRQRNRLP